ncbi:MAG: PhoX family protein, partial [Gammaproteobacteria bacterium]|nr:PhoX family protein [Gammaproteobacteria bacterium]
MNNRKQIPMFKMNKLSLLVRATLIGSALTMAACSNSDDVSENTSLKRFATVPLGAEVTGMFITKAGDFFYNAQHPSGTNIYPYNRATVGVLVGQDMRSLATDFTALVAPASATDKQSFMTALGNYQMVAQEGDTMAGALPFGLGAIVNTAGDTAVAYSNDPDFNAFVPTNEANTEGYLFTNWEYRPGGMSRLQVAKDAEGNWAVMDAMNVDFSSVAGTWVNCFGTLSPWNTPLTSEELYFDDTSLWNEGSDTGVQTLASYLGYTDGSVNWPNPYRYGYIAEITAPTTSPVPVKRFAMGRYSHENSVVMPDNKTVYLSDDGSNVVFFKFVADIAGDLSAGTLYAAKVTQDVGVSDAASAGFDIEWIMLGHSDDTTIETWIDDYDAVTTADYISAATSYISDTEIIAWATDMADGTLDSVDGRVAFLESRKAAAALGATAEFNKMEGVVINYDRAADGTVPYMYMAMSDVKAGMSDGAGDINVDEKRCGVVYQMQLDTSSWNTARMVPVVAGGAYDSTALVNQCDIDNIANPDNLL